MNSKRKFEKDPNLEENPQEGKDYLLVLHNDDVHDFMYVIDSLIEICDHDSVQAEQCTYFVHYRGECDIKTGKYHHLKEMYDGLLEKGLTVSLN
ncbi:ATP-dependent Clp protease adaptor ClpS [Bacteroidota bacterium]